MRKTNELTNAINQYFSSPEGISVYYYGTGNAAAAFADIFQTGEKLIGDAPDMLILKNHTAIIVEHFEFDSYTVTRKGSQSKREQSRINRTFEKAEKTAEPNNIFHDKIHGCSSYQNYIQNVCRSFNEHYKRINTYKKNLKNCGLLNDASEVKVLFFIEDTSPMGSSVVDQSKASSSIQPVCLGRCQEFLSLLKNCPDVNYILACSTVDANKIVWFIDRDEITEYQRESIDYSIMKFIDYEPHVTRFQFLFSND